MQDTTLHSLSGANVSRFREATDVCPEPLATSVDEATEEAPDISNQSADCSDQALTSCSSNACNDMSEACSVVVEASVDNIEGNVDSEGFNTPPESESTMGSEGSDLRFQSDASVESAAFDGMSGTRASAAVDGPSVNEMVASSSVEGPPGTYDTVAFAAVNEPCEVDVSVSSSASEGSSRRKGIVASAAVNGPSQTQANVDSTAVSGLSGSEANLASTISEKRFLVAISPSPVYISRRVVSLSNPNARVNDKRKTAVSVILSASKKLANPPKIDHRVTFVSQNANCVLESIHETDFAACFPDSQVKSEVGSPRRLSAYESPVSESLPAADSLSSKFSEFHFDVETNLDELKNELKDELKDEVQHVPGLPLVNLMCGDLRYDGGGALDDNLLECAWCGEVFRTAAEVESHSVKHAEPDEGVNSGEAAEVQKEEDEDAQTPKPLSVRPKPWYGLVGPQSIPQTEPAVAVPSSTSVNTKLNTDSKQLRRQFVLVRVPRVVGSMVKARPAFRFVPGTAKTTREAAKPPGAQAVVSTVADQSLATTPLISTARSRSALQTATAARDPPVDVLSSPGPTAEVANAHQMSLACSIGTTFEPVDRNVFECSECAVVCVTRKDLAVHRMTRHGSETWHRCLEPDCKSTFHSLLRQRVHTAIAHKLVHFTCQHCSECLPSALLLEAHMAVKHNRTPVTLQCPLCPARSPHSTLCRSVAALTSHFRSHHAGHLPLTCSWCGWRTNRIADMLPHHRNHVDRLRQLHCPACVAWFPTRDVLVAHVRAEHGKGATYDCPTCKKCCKSLRRLHKHLRNKHPQELPYKCLCGEAFASPNMLRKHAEATMHMAGAGGPLFNFRCTRCRYLSSDAVQIMEHHDTAHVDLLPLERMTQLLTLMRDAKVIKEAGNQ